MPVSRNPKTRTRHSAFGRTSPHIPFGEATLEGIFDRAKLARRRAHRKVLLYHYTGLEAAESIISSQRFHATAHDCTNDEAELTSADATILEALAAAETRATGLTAQILRAFAESYTSSRISASPRTYLVCFSETRDDPHQWCRYGGRSAGVCLGLRLFEIPEPTVPELATQFMPVQYDPAEWRSKIDKYLDDVIDMLAKPRLVNDLDRTKEIVFEVLGISTAAWALTSKEPAWAPEHETRMICLVRKNMIVQHESMVRSDGSVKRFISIPVTSLPRLPIGEIIIGPTADFASSQQRIVQAMNRAGYLRPESKVVCSNVGAAFAATDH